jgi:hypothetical protein
MKTVRKTLQNKGNIRIILLLGIILSITLFSSSVYALNAAVGNGKFVISNATVGDIIQRAIKVYNNNSYDVRIELIPNGNLTNDIKIIDNNITMTSNSEKEFRFSVRVTKEGRNDGGIIVTFTPANVSNGKNGIALPTSMVIFAKKATGKVDWTGWLNPTKNNESNTNKNQTGTDPGNDDSGNSIGLAGVLLIITAIVLIVLVIMVFLYSKRKNNGVKEEKLNTKKSKG